MHGIIFPLAPRYPFQQLLSQLMEMFHHHDADSQTLSQIPRGHEWLIWVLTVAVVGSVESEKEERAFFLRKLAVLVQEVEFLRGGD